MKDRRKMDIEMEVGSYTTQMGFVMKVSSKMDIGMGMEFWNLITFKSTMGIGLMMKYKDMEK